MLLSTGVLQSTMYTTCLHVTKAKHMVVNLLHTYYCIFLLLQWFFV